MNILSFVISIIFIFFVYTQFVLILDHNDCVNRAYSKNYHRQLNRLIGKKTPFLHSMSCLSKVNLKIHITGNVDNE